MLADEAFLCILTIQQSRQQLHKEKTWFTDRSLRHRSVRGRGPTLAWTDVTALTVNAEEDHTEQLQ